MTWWIYLLVKDNEIKGICRSNIIAQLINARHGDDFEIIKYQADCILPFSIAKTIKLVNVLEKEIPVTEINADGT